jgi:serine protease Do
VLIILPPAMMHRCFALLAMLIAVGYPGLAAAELPAEVLSAQQQRVEVIERITPPTVAIFDLAGEGGGSGVLISPDGYALTNFHVTSACGVAMKCGLADGKLYDAVIVGIDAPGDVALIKLLGRDDFPHAELGDSDTARMGDWVLVAGNPFLLADDFRPTITYGILSGVHRYQYPAGTLLEYADCLQTDASINPGNSGGPLFDSQGRVIGINGRGSFEKRGRVNVGVGYAISINQIKRFLSHLKAGRLVDHATLGATVATIPGGRVAVDDLLESSDAYRRGLRYGDFVTLLADRMITSANSLQNAVGTYPSGWRVPLEFRRHDQQFRTVVRLASLHAAGELEAMLEAEEQNREPIEPPDDSKEPDEKREAPRAPLPKPEIPAVVKTVYEERTGFANYWFNRQAQQRIAEACPQLGTLDPKLAIEISGNDGESQPVLLLAASDRAEYRSSRGQFYAPLERTIDETVGPPGSGGLMAAAAAWRQLLAEGVGAYSDAYYVGQLPFGAKLELHDVLAASYRGAEVEFYFDPDSGDLAGLLLSTADDVDSSIVYFSDYRDQQGQRLPFTWSAHFGDTPYVEISVDRYHQKSGVKKEQP